MIHNKVDLNYTLLWEFGILNLPLRNIYILGNNGNMSKGLQLPTEAEALSPEAPFFFYQESGFT